MLSRFDNSNQTKPASQSVIAKIAHYTVNGFSSFFHYATNEKPIKSARQQAKLSRSSKSYEDQSTEKITFTSLEELLENYSNQNKFLVSDLEWKLIQQYLNSVKPICKPTKVSKKVLLNFSKLDFEANLFHSFLIIPIVNSPEDYIILAISHRNIGSNATGKIKMLQSQGGKLFILKITFEKPNDENIQDVAIDGVTSFEHKSLRNLKRFYSIKHFINGYDLDYLINIPLYKTASDKFKIKMAIAITVAYKKLHTAKMAHGDIHSGNIILKVISNSDVVAELIDFEKSQILDSSKHSALFKRDLEQLMKIFLVMGIPENVYNELSRPNETVFDLEYISKRLIMAVNSYEYHDFIAEASLRSTTQALLFNYRLCKKYEISDMYNHPERYALAKYSPRLMA